MDLIELFTKNETETKEIAQIIGQNIDSSFYIALKGDLGAGKTAFVQGLANGLQIDPSYYVTSPTYNIIQTYPGKLTLLHADLYRISDIDELELTGFTDILNEEPCIAAVEWPEKIEKEFDFDMIIKISILNSDKRKFTLISCGLKASHLIQKLSLRYKA